MLSLTMRWFISVIWANSPDAQTPSAPRTWSGWEKQESAENGTSTTLYNTENPLIQRTRDEDLLSIWCWWPCPAKIGSSARFPPPITMLSSATLGLFLMFWRFCLIVASPRHIFRVTTGVLALLESENEWMNEFGCEFGCEVKERVLGGQTFSMWLFIMACWWWSC